MLLNLIEPSFFLNQLISEDYYAGFIRFSQAFPCRKCLVVFLIKIYRLSSYDTTLIIRYDIQHAYAGLEVKSMIVIQLLKLSDELIKPHLKPVLVLTSEYEGKVR